jgi:hypothetical protein
MSIAASTISANAAWARVLAASSSFGQDEHRVQVAVACVGGDWR